jgi:4-amino-4-deoxy-L-arabinose transferase-like glycosyltransferase
MPSLKDLPSEGIFFSAINWLAPVSIFFIALVVRLAITFELKETSPLFEYPIIDAMVYDRLARVFADTGQWGETGAFYQPPLYPLFLAGIYKVWGGSYLWPRIIQSLLGTASCLVLNNIGSRFAGKFTGWIAGIICAFYGPLIYFEMELMAPTLTVFLSLLGLSLLYSGLEKQQLLFLFISGIITGLAIITWPLVGLFACAGAVTVIIKYKNDLRKCLLPAMAIIIGAILPVIPISFLNFAKGQAVIISSNGPITFYAANNIDWENTVLFRPGYNWEKIVTLPYRLHSAEEIRKIGKSNIYISEVINYIKQNPYRYVKAEMKKLSQLFYGFEIMNPTDIYFFKQFSPILDKLIFQNKFLKFPFGVLFPFAMVGIFFGIKLKKENNILFLMYLLFGCFGLLLFCVSARFRLIIIPLLILYAALGIQEIFSMFTKRHNKNLIAFVFSYLVCFFALANIEIFHQQELFERPVVKSQNYFAIGRVMIRQGRNEDALPWLMKAVKIDTNYSDAWVDLGRAKYSLGDRNGAIEAMLKAHQVAPDYPLPLFNLAIFYDHPTGNSDRAKFYFKEFLNSAENYYEKLLRGLELINYSNERLKVLMNDT